MACFLGSSPVRQYTEGWDIEPSSGSSPTRLSTFATRRGMPVMYVTEDTTRANPEDIRVLYTTAVEAGSSPGVCRGYRGPCDPERRSDT